MLSLLDSKLETTRHKISLLKMMQLCPKLLATSSSTKQLYLKLQRASVILPDRHIMLTMHNVALDCFQGKMGNYRKMIRVEQNVQQKTLYTLPPSQVLVTRLRSVAGAQAYSAKPCQD